MQELQNSVNRCSMGNSTSRQQEPTLRTRDGVTWLPNEQQPNARSNKSKYCIRSARTSEWIYMVPDNSFGYSQRLPVIMVTDRTNTNARSTWDAARTHNVHVRPERATRTNHVVADSFHGISQDIMRNDHPPRRLNRAVDENNNGARVAGSRVHTIVQVNTRSRSSNKTTPFRSNETLPKSSVSPPPIPPRRMKAPRYSRPRIHTVGTITSRVGVMPPQYANCVDDLKSTLLRHTRIFTKIIDIDSGLLDALRAAGFLTYSQFHLLHNSPKHVKDRIEQLVEIIANLSPSKLDQDRFIRVFDTNQHIHVSNYIRGNGNRESTFVDNWPLICSDPGVKLLDRHWQELIDLIDSVNGLVDKLHACEVINRRQVRRIEESTRHAVKNFALLDIIRRGSIRSYKTFLSCLRKTNQNVAMLLLDPAAAGVQRPLSESQKSSLQVSYSSSINRLQSSYDLLGRMFSKGLITIRQKQWIEPAPTEADKNKRVFEIVRGMTSEEYSMFMQCLEETGQGCLARSLSGDTDLRTVKTI